MQKWIRTDEKLVYEGYRKILRRTYKLPNDKLADFEVIKSNGGAAILAITEDQKVVCFKQFRPGPEEILCELPGGGIEPGEEPLDAIKRELLEECGYEADIEYIGSYCRDSYVSSKWQMFIGRNAEKTADQKLEDTEFGEVKLLTIAEFKKNLFAGQMSDTTLGYAGLYRLGLLR